MDLFAGRDGFSRGVYLRTGGGLDGHTPRSVGLDFLDKLRRMERIRHARSLLKAQVDASTPIHTKHRPGRSYLSIPHIGYARVGPRDSGSRRNAGRRRLPDSNRLPNIMREETESGVTRSNHSDIAMEDVMNALQNRNSTLERSKRHSDRRVERLEKLSYDSELPPATAQMALRTVKGHRKSFRYPRNITEVAEWQPPEYRLQRYATVEPLTAKCETYDTSHLDWSLQRDIPVTPTQNFTSANGRCVAMGTTKRSALEMAVRHNSVSCLLDGRKPRHGIQDIQLQARTKGYDARAKLHHLLVANKMKRQSAEEEQSSSITTEGNASSTMSTSSICDGERRYIPGLQRSHTTPALPFHEGQGSGTEKQLLTRSVLKTDSKADKSRSGLVRRVTIILPSEDTDADG